mgnify:CR=1 FL=1
MKRKWFICKLWKVTTHFFKLILFSTNNFLDKSDAVNFTITQDEISSDVEFNKTVALSWDYPCFANGNITQFLIYYNISDPQNLAIKKGQTHFEYPLTLDPNIKYTIKLLAQSEKFDGKELSKEFQLKPGSKFRFLLFNKNYINFFLSSK